MKRRKFIYKVCSASAACSIPMVLTTLQSCTSYNSEDDPDNVEVNPIDENLIEFDLNDTKYAALKQIGASIVTMASDFDKAGLIFFRQNQTTLLAFSRKCPHAGSAIDPFISGISTCPNHGAKFRTDGSAISGPTNASLKQYTTKINGSIVTVTK